MYSIGVESLDSIDMNLHIYEVSEISEEVYSLLLLADPSRKVIDEYISRGKVNVASLEGEIVGEYVLIYTRPETIEIVNIAVKEKFQGKGIGGLLLEDAVKSAAASGAKVLDIGTGNSSIHQLGLYQKKSFRILGIDRDFFIKHYNEPIYENGIQCIDMIRLSLDL